MMQISLATARDCDLPLLYSWMRELRRIDPMASESFVPAVASQAAMRQLVEDQRQGRAWLIVEASQPVGYALLVFSFSVEFGGRTAFIDELYIVDRARGRGLGRQVVELIIAQAKLLGVQNLLLEVTDANNAAVALYDRCGFTHRTYKLMSKWIGN